MAGNSAYIRWALSGVAVETKAKGSGVAVSVAVAVEAGRVAVIVASGAVGRNGFIILGLVRTASSPRKRVRNKKALPGIGNHRSVKTEPRV